MASSRSSYEAPDFVPASPKPSVRFAPGTRERPRRPSLTDQVQINVEATVNATGDLVGKTADLVGKGANAVVKETKKIADGTGKELQKLGKNAVKTTEMLAQKQHGYLKQIGDSISEAVAIFFLQRFLARIGVLVTEALIDAEMPNGVQHLIQRSSAAAWEVVSQQVRDSVHAAYSYEDEAYLDMVSRFRTGAPSFWPKGQRLPQPYTWFRARLLHTLMPCDATFWSTAFDPVAWIIRIASVTPVLSALMMVFLFFAIRKRDEDELDGIALLMGHQRAELVNWAVGEGIVSEEEREPLLAALTALYDVLRVDAFDPSGLRELAQAAKGKRRVVERPAPQEPLEEPEPYPETGSYAVEERTADADIAEDEESRDPTA